MSFVLVYDLVQLYKKSVPDHTKMELYMRISFTRLISVIFFSVILLFCSIANATIIQYEYEGTVFQTGDNPSWIGYRVTGVFSYDTSTFLDFGTEFSEIISSENNFHSFSIFNIYNEVVLEHYNEFVEFYVWDNALQPYSNQTRDLFTIRGSQSNSLNSYSELDLSVYKPIDVTNDFIINNEPPSSIEIPNIPLQCDRCGVRVEGDYVYSLNARHVNHNTAFSTMWSLDKLTRVEVNEPSNTWIFFLIVSPLLIYRSYFK